MTTVLIALVVALAVVVLAAIARDVAIRAFADRVDSRVKRCAEAETKADDALTRMNEVEKKVRELEKLVHATSARTVRR